MAVDYGSDFVYYQPCLSSWSSAPLFDEFLELSRRPEVNITMEAEGDGPNSYIILSTMDVDAGDTPLPLLGPVLLNALMEGKGLDRQHQASGHQGQGEPQVSMHGDLEDDEFEVIPTVRFPNPLRPQPIDVRAEENRAAIGGMRRPKRAVKRLGLQKWGKRVREIFDQYLTKHPEMVKTCVNAIGSDNDEWPTEEDLR